MNKKDYIIKTTIGSSLVKEYPSLVKPDRKYVKNGEYKAKIDLTEENKNILLTKIKDVINKKAEKENIKEYNDIKYFEVDNTIFIKTRKQFPIFDINNKKIIPSDISETSEIQTNIDITPYIYKNNGIYTIGVNFYINAIKVIKLVEKFTGGNIEEYGFGETNVENEEF
jgi:hypothetical protein